jgi:hypothetical protein
MQSTGLTPEHPIKIPKEKEKMEGLKQPTTLCITKQRAGLTPEQQLPRDE